MRSLRRFDDFPPLEGVVGIRFLESLLFALDRFLLCRRGFFEESDFLTLVFSLLSETSPRGDGLVSICVCDVSLDGEGFCVVFIPMFDRELVSLLADTESLFSSFPAKLSP